MSGICGLFLADGAPVADADVQAMTAMLERRGPHGSRCRVSGPLGVGHTLLQSLPGRSGDPFFLHAQSGCVVVADARLDYRQALLDALAAHDLPAEPGDAELILRAYLQWGEQCLDRLYGDFAFAIWDPRERKLVLARDHFGMRPLYYHHAAGGNFFFASEPRSILVLPQVPYRLNEGRIADYLLVKLEWIDLTSTFFDGVYRLPPGHKAVVTSNGLDVSEYWKPNAGPELAPMRDEEYRDGLVEVLTRAVDERLRAPAGVVGSMQSGGIDSGSVVAVARELMAGRGNGPLPTVSAVQPEGADCSESDAIRAAATLPRVSPVFVQPDSLSERLDTMLSGYGEPFDGQCMLLRAVYDAAQQHGIRVLLDGAAGDVTLNEEAYIARLIRSGQLRLAWSEMRGEAARYNGWPAMYSLALYSKTALLPAPVKKLVRRLLVPFHDGRAIRNSLVSRQFADHVRLDERLARNRETFPGTWVPDYAESTVGRIRRNVAAGRERYSRLASTAGVEPRDPYLDLHVVQYCARLPGHLRMRDGWNKRALRDAMAGRVHDKVRWARGKPHLGWLFNSTVTRMAADAGRLDLAMLQAGLGDYVDPQKLARAWQQFRDGGDDEALHTAHVLLNWLDENRTRPVPAENTPLNPAAT